MPNPKPKVRQNRLPKFPLRTCVVCRTLRKKEDLLRLPHPAKAGRGAYVCPQECLTKLQENSKGLHPIVQGSNSNKKMFLSGRIL